MRLLPVCFLLMLSNAVESARILCILPVPSYSHYEGPNLLMLNLAQKGHQVTVISPYLPKVKHENYRNITIPIKTLLSDNTISLYDTLRRPINDYLKILFNFGLYISESFFQNENFKDLMESQEKFDAVIFSHFFCDSFQVLCHKYNAPCIIYSPLVTSAFVDFKIANPAPFSYTKDFYMPYTQQMSFLQRTYNSLTHWYSRYLAYSYLYPKHEELIRKYFNVDLKMDDLFRNTSLILRNSHIAFNGALPTVPNMVEIGGFHIKSPKNLSGDLRKYLDDAKEGVIYFSMGSILKSSMMPKDKLKSILKVFARINRKILWKYEDDSLVGLPGNVKIVKWAPQIDVLAHPNVKVFISHGGAFSTIESINFKVPIVGLPIFGDQDSNMQFCVSKGFARSIVFEEINEDNLYEAINDILTQPKYAENVKLQSQILQDSPITQMEKAIYYIEYVIRYNGAPHLKVPAAEFPWYKYQSLDVVAFLFALTTASLFIIYKCAMMYYRKSKNHDKIE